MYDYNLELTAIEDATMDILDIEADCLDQAEMAWDEELPL